jgi:Ni/Co efflux regulator RcnB
MKKLLIAILLLFSSIAGFAQSVQDKAKMERERQAIQEEIRQIQSK